MDINKEFEKLVEEVEIDESYSQYGTGAVGSRRGTDYDQPSPTEPKWTPKKASRAEIKKFQKAFLQRLLDEPEWKDYGPREKYYWDKRDSSLLHIGNAADTYHMVDAFIGKYSGVGVNTDWFSKFQYNKKMKSNVKADIKEEVKLEDVIKEIVGTEWHDGHEPQGIDDQYVEEMEDGEEIEEASKSDIQSFGKKLSDYAKKRGGIDKDDFKFIAKEAIGGHLPNPNSLSRMDTEPREVVLNFMAKEFGRKFVEKEYGVKFNNPREDSGKDFDFSKDPPDPDLGSEEEEDEARTYLDREDERKKKKSGKIPQSQKKSRWGSGGYGKGEEVEEDYDKNQLLRVQHDEKLIAETGDICSLDRRDLRSKSMQKVYDKKCSPEMIKKKKSIFGKIAKNLELYNSVGEQKMEEAVNLKQLKKEYDKNEDQNRHTENYLMLAKAFGSKSEVKKVQDIMKRNEKQGHTSKSDMDWMYKNINPYYDKIRNEETMKTEKLVDTVRKVLLGEGEGDQAEYQKKRKAVAKKFGVESCSALKDEKEKKACYKALDDAHVADHEEQVELEKMRKEGVGDLSDKELKTKMKDASTQKETDAACGEMGKRRLKMEKKKVTESAALQLKMAFDDAKIKIKGVKGGKLVIAKKDKKKAEDVISKQMKNPSDAKRVLGSQIVFEEPEKTISKLFSHVRKLMSK